MLQNRIELFGVEVEEQKARLLRMFLFGAVAVVLANTALLLVTATIILLAGEGSQLPVLVGLSLLYCSAAAGMLRTPCSSLTRHAGESVRRRVTRTALARSFNTC